ncbi:hypothetical protein ACFLXV_00115 [Chloroflexota bacterium]
MNKLLILVVTLLVMSPAAAGCGGESAGRLPVWNIGDTWEFKTVTETKESFSTLEVVGEELVDGRQCYVLQSEEKVDTSPSPEIIRTTSCISKATIDMIKIQMLDEDSTVAQENTYSYEPGNRSLFPLQVGDELEQTVTLYRPYDLMGQEEVLTQTYTHICRVEAEEEITVPAGTFICFRIVDYDEDNNAVITQWYSDEAKTYIKTVRHDIEFVDELISYSLQ